MSTSVPTSVCPSCGSSRVVPSKVQPPELPLRECRDCGLAFLAAQPDSFDSKLYSYYRSRMGLPKDQVYSSLNRPRLAQVLAKLSKTSDRSLLDVGCGAGQWVSFASESGWRAKGLDLSAEAIELARSLGADAERLDFFDGSLDGSKFGAVTMWELLEHVPRPQTFIERAAQLLTPDGTLALSTPNFDSLGRRWHGPNWLAFYSEHVVYLRPETLRALLLRSFKKVEIESRGITLAPRRATRQEQRAVQQTMRESVASSRSRQLAKSVADRVLRHVLVGEGLVAWASHPR